MANDYYKTLGVSKDASDAEIKSAYRKLAREWHPDVAKDKPNAEQKFKEINEAYQVLSDAQKRSQYDQFGKAGFQGGASGGAGFDPFSGFGSQGGSGPFQWSYQTSGGAQGSEDPFDIFEQVFGFRGFGGQRKGRNLRYSLSIDFEDSIKGFEQTVSVDGHKLKVKLPPGVRPGTQVKFAGKGENPSKNLEPGDLFIVIDINPHSEFARQGEDIFSLQTINIAQASLGASVNVKTIDTKSATGFTEKKVKIPSGTQPATQIRLKGFGMPNPKGFGRGDHYITIKVEVPKKLTREQKQALENLW